MLKLLMYVSFLFFVPSRHTAVLVDSIKKGLGDADSEARVEARK